MKKSLLSIVGLTVLATGCATQKVADTEYVIVKWEQNGKNCVYTEIRGTQVGSERAYQQKLSKHISYANTRCEMLIHNEMMNRNSVQEDYYNPKKDIYSDNVVDKYITAKERHFPKISECPMKKFLKEHGKDIEDLKNPPVPLKKPSKK